ALMVCVPPHRSHDLASMYFEHLYRIFLATSDLRSFGSCALELSYMAAGRLDGYYELCLGYYDMAAGACILQEAGGSFAPADPHVPFSDGRCDLVASNGLIQEWLLHMVQA
ncbi:MAG: inositol monophosphatase family protein, partial [Sphaerochaeta sp.]|nr:inositol monophosphatase family protein [Sphaerochaeta sp.]